MAITSAALLNMSQTELDSLFKQSEAGPIPAGEASGTVIVAPGSHVSDNAAGIANVVGWQGKVFDPVKGELRNKILPVGIPAIAAKVRKDASWFDGKECIVLDYSHSSIVAKKVRDEIRLVAPNLYLGIVYFGDEKTINFALDFAAPVLGLWARIKRLFGRS
ncbi:hypothetical protein AYO38_04370 [bacterium SCGC AG-212-C10]|nr:hypothetical protein AYO38_04370 [bacterium SCGC AG-212-C10]